MQAKNNYIRRRRDSRAPLVAGNGPLSRVPPAAAFLVVIVVFALAVWLKGTVGALLMGLLGVGVLALLAVTWQALRPAERVLRVIVVLILAAVAISLVR
jgi:energy-coupling factor transporter transmembrane protein EcfT